MYGQSGRKSVKPGGTAEMFAFIPVPAEQLGQVFLSRQPIDRKEYSHE